MAEVVAVRLGNGTARKLDAIAAIFGQSREQVIEQALAAFIEDYDEQGRAIARALESYRSGEAVLIPHEQVMSRLESKFKKT